MLEIICEDYQSGDWISSLPGYQQNRIADQIKNGLSKEEIAEFWSSGITTLSLAPFGGLPPKNFYDAFKSEFRALICGSDKYADLRKKITKNWKNGKVWVVSTISVTIASTIGVAVALVSPLVALLLETVCTLGVNSWCSVNTAV